MVIETYRNKEINYEKDLFYIINNNVRVNKKSLISIKKYIDVILDIKDINILKGKTFIGFKKKAGYYSAPNLKDLEKNNTFRIYYTMEIFLSSDYKDSIYIIGKNEYDYLIVKTEMLNGKYDVITIFKKHIYDILPKDIEDIMNDLNKTEMKFVSILEKINGLNAQKYLCNNELTILKNKLKNI
jgi:hypothetical protein